MEKRSGLNRMLLATTLVGFTLGLTSSVGVLGAFAEARDEFQAPRGFHLNTSFDEGDPPQAPRGQDMQSPRSGVGGSGISAAAASTAEL
jgi:hypothetical protein